MTKLSIDRVYTAFTVVVVMLVLAGGLVKLYPLYTQYRSLSRQAAALDRKTEDVERQTAELNEKQRLFQTDREFLESIARQNHRVYPGEIVFLFEGGKNK